MLAKGKEVELEIDSAAFEGSAVARLEGFVVFVRNAVPGDRVRARIVRKKRSHADAVVEEVLKPSPHRVTPKCRYFESCGGCSWQNLAYEVQLKQKRQQVVDLFQRVGGLEFPEVPPVVASPESLYYRNKMEFTFGNRRWLTRAEIESGQEYDRHFALGLHVPKRFDRILDLEDCYLQSEMTPEIVNFVRQLAMDEKWSPYNVHTHSGFLRNLVIRTGKRTGDVLINLVTNRQDEERMVFFRDKVLERFPATTTIVNSVNDTRSPVAAGDETALHGTGAIHDSIGDYRFKIRPTTFFQPNTAQAEQIYELVKNWSDLHGTEEVYDLYCGVGAISLYVSRDAARVTGFDDHERSIEEAISNGRNNGISNCRFVAHDAADAVRTEVVAENGRPDLIILDPPRSGMHKDVCAGLVSLAAPRLIYISCNPATQARDLALLSPTYRIEAVQPFDMFPQTHHIENVVLLHRRS